MSDGPPSASEDALRRAKRLHERRAQGLGSPAPAGTDLDLVEARSALIQLAISARERSINELLPDRSAARLLRTQLKADLTAYREILREHAPMATGHCCRCRYPDSLLIAAHPWPCPTVEAVERGLLRSTVHLLQRAEP